MYGGEPTVFDPVAQQRVRRRLGEHGVVEQLGDAEVEQLGQKAPRALDHHHVRRLEVAVDDAALVRGLHDLGHALEERHELVERQRAALAQPVIERDALHHLHRDPEQAIGVLDAERVHVGGVRVVQPRRELGLAHEALQHDVVPAQPLVQHLDDGLATQERLLTAIDRTKTTGVDSFAKNEFSDGTAAKVLAVTHPC
jgi:hypothetical protein